jgi:hypothetical protein
MCFCYAALDKQVLEPYSAELICDRVWYQRGCDKESADSPGTLLPHGRERLFHPIQYNPPNIIPTITPKKSESPKKIPLPPGPIREKTVKEMSVGIGIVGSWPLWPMPNGDTKLQTKKGVPPKPRRMLMCWSVTGRMVSKTWTVCSIGLSIPCGLDSKSKYKSRAQRI